MRTFSSVDDFREAAGQHLGSSRWFPMEQAVVDAFAATTGDRQWIHTDPKRARHGPYRGTIAHGYLVLSLLPVLAADVYRVDGVAATVNYGLDRVRFPAPTRVGSRVRAGVELVSTTEVSGGAVHALVRMTVEAEDSERPVCVADTIRRFVPASAPGVPHAG